MRHLKQSLFIVVTVALVLVAAFAALAPYNWGP